MTSTDFKKIGAISPAESFNIPFFRFNYAGNFLKADEYETLSQYMNIRFQQLTMDVEGELKIEDHAPKLCTDEYLKSIMGKYYQSLGLL